MRLDEITKTEFVDNLTDPAMAELKKMNRTVKKEINIAGIMYGLKAYEHPDLGTRRKAIVSWDFRYVPQEAIKYMNGMEQKIAAHYKHELDHWVLKGWSSQSNVTEFELIEK
jgi:hypothetical protein